MLTEDYKVLTDLSSRAFVVQRPEGDGGQQNGDVEEDSGGGVLQQTAVLPGYTLMDYSKRSYNSSRRSSQSKTFKEDTLGFLLAGTNRLNILYKKSMNTVCEVGGVEGESAAEVVVNSFTSFQEIFALRRRRRRKSVADTWG